MNGRPSPLDAMLCVMYDAISARDGELTLKAAACAAPYIHPKLAMVQHSVAPSQQNTGIDAPKRPETPAEWMRRVTQDREDFRLSIEAKTSISQSKSEIIEIGSN